MVSRLIAAALGIAAMALAPAASAAFPEDFEVLRTGSSSSAEASSEGSAASAGGTGAVLNASSASSAGSLSSAASSGNEEEEEAEPVEEETDDDGIGEAAMLAAQQQLTRAQFTALIVEKLYTQDELDRCFWDLGSSRPPRFNLVFTDVHVNDRFAKHICVAMLNGIVKGQGDGSFRPDQKITFAESAKILSRAFNLAPYAEANRLQPWYREYVEALASRNAIPMSISRMDQLVTAAEAAEMFTRVATGTTNMPSRRYSDLVPQPPRTVTVPQKSRPAPVSAVSKPATGASSSVSSAPASAAAASEMSSSRRSFWDRF